MLFVEREANFIPAAGRRQPLRLARNMGTSIKMLEQFYGHTANRAMANELTKSRKRKMETGLPWEEIDDRES